LEHKLLTAKHQKRSQEQQAAEMPHYFRIGIGVAKARLTRIEKPWRTKMEIAAIFIFLTGLGDLP
jgi:hypothetical protein